MLSDTPPGKKGMADESFPVAWLLPRRLRGPVMAYYAFARLADDRADCPTLTAAEKKTCLDILEADLIAGQGQPEAIALARVLESHAIPLAHASDLLIAFRRDADNPPCEDWPSLLAYCEVSAMPVGRFLLALCGETRAAARTASDALCAALQILNHTQDIGRDWITLQRCYMPRDWMTAHGVEDHHLAANHSSAAVRSLLDQVLARTDILISRAAPLPDAISNRFLRAQAAATLHLAKALRRRLGVGDPLACRIAPGRLDWAGALAVAVKAGVWR